MSADPVDIKRHNAEIADLSRLQAEVAARAICGEVVKPYVLDIRIEELILKKENQRLRQALRDIIQHMKIVAGNTPSAVVTIAKKALEEK